MSRVEKGERSGFKFFVGFMMIPSYSERTFGGLLTDGDFDLTIKSRRRSVSGPSRGVL